METISPAENIIMRKLGGLTKTANLLSTQDRAFPISTVQGWRDRGKIPQEHWLQLIDAARATGVALDVSMFLTTPAEAA